MAPLTAANLGEMVYAGDNTWVEARDADGNLTAYNKVNNRWTGNGFTIDNIKIRLVPGVTKNLLRYQPTSSGMYGGAALSE